MRLYPVDPIVVQNFVTSRARIVKALPDQYPELLAAVQQVGGEEEVPNTLWRVGLVHHSLVTLVAASAWSWYSVSVRRTLSPCAVSSDRLF